MTAELQVRLAELSAPGQLVDWARSFPDLESCWRACSSPELLLWMAARGCTTAAERRAGVSCLAELTRRAESGGPGGVAVGGGARVPPGRGTARGGPRPGRAAPGGRTRRAAGQRSRRAGR